MVVGLRERRTELPAVGRDVVDLDRTDRLPIRRIAAEEVELAVQFGERQLGVRFEQWGPHPPFAARRQHDGWVARVTPPTRGDNNRCC